MRVSLSVRIFIGFAVVVACFGAASIYGMASVTSLRHELHFLRKRALPLLDSLRRSGLELRGFDEALQRAAPHDLDWVARFVPGARPFERLDRVRRQVALLHASARPPRLARLVRSADLPLPRLGAMLASERASTTARDRVAADPDIAPLLPGHKLSAGNDAETFDVLVLALRRAVAERRYTEASRLVVELRRIIRQVHGALGLAERAFEQALNRRFAETEKSEAQLGVVVVASVAIALVVSIIALLVMLATVRPMAHLADVVRRFAAGERQVRARTGGATEIRALALEYNRMADALVEREALLAGQREELTRADRLATLGQLAARMAHEIRNPLSSIGLNAEMLEDDLRRDDFDRAEAGELLEAIGREVEHLRAVTETYLERARPARAEHARTDLSALLSRLADFVRSDLGRRGVTMTVQTTADLFADIDEALVRSALWNLVRNGWEALPDGGRLWLEAERRREDGKGWVALAVEDSGQGIEETARGRLFEPFFTTKERGTGIGLALVQEAARVHGGRAVVVAGVHGGGARFELRLPAA